MITDKQTNHLYLADTLPSKATDFYGRFEKLLQSLNIGFDILPNTKDVWAVDYMPIQTDIDRFVRFLYAPNYLLEYQNWSKTISDTDAICKQIGIETIKTNIKLDGGNISRTTDKVIISDIIFSENPTYERKQLLKEIKDLLQVDKIYLIPQEPGDFTGHSDGMARFIDENTLIINDYSKAKEPFRRAFDIAIHNTGLDYIKIPYTARENKKSTHANGLYINYLQMENTVIVPIFDKKEDEQAVKILESTFAGQRINTINGNQIAEHGGILNCITWNIKKTK